MPNAVTELESFIWEVLHEVYDPEVGINIVDLGLVYRIEIEGDDVRVIMTLTTPGCPLHDTITEAVDESIHFNVPYVEKVTVDLVWDPPWSPQMITAAGREELGWRQ